MKINNFTIMPKLFFVSVFMIFACLGTVSAMDFDQSVTSEELQNFINTPGDNVINLQAGDYYFLKNLSIKRSLTIQSNDNDIVNIKSNDGTGTLFNIESKDVTIKNLNIIDFNVGVYANSYNINIDNLIIRNNTINCKINAIEITSILVGNYRSSDIKDILIENNTINAVDSGIYIHGNGSAAGNSMKATNIIIKNNSIYAENAIRVHVFTLNGLNILGNNIKGKNGGILLGSISSSPTMSNIVVNYNSIVADVYLIHSTKTIQTANINSDYNWWGYNTPPANKIVGLQKQPTNYYNVKLVDTDGATKIGDSVYTIVTLNGNPDDGKNLPDFNVTIDNYGKTENVPAKGGEIKIWMTGQYDIQYKNQESNTPLPVTIINNQVATSLEIGKITINQLDEINISAILKNVHGIELPNKEINFTVNGMEYIQFTDNDGFASIEFDAAGESTWVIEISFNGDTTNTESTVSKVLNFADLISVTVSDNLLVQKMIDRTPVGGTLDLSGYDLKDVQIIIDKSITIIGGKITSTLKAPIFTITGSDVTISGFDLSNTYPNGIVFDIKDGASNVNIINNYIHDSHTGITMFNASNVNVSNNNITRCFEGIALEGKLHDITIEGNIISGKGSVKPNTEGRRNDGAGSGIVVNAIIPNLAITKNTITAHTHGIHFDDGIGDAEVSVESMIYFNSITGNHKDLDASELIRSKEDKIFTTGPNWYGGLVGIDICPRLVKSVTSILLGIRSVDDLGNFEFYFYYTDKVTGKEVIVEEGLPPIDISFQFNGKKEVITAKGTTNVDFTKLISDNPLMDNRIFVNLGWSQDVELILTSEDYLAALNKANGNPTSDNDGDSGDGQNGGSNNPVIDTINNIVNNINSIFNPNTDSQVVDTSSSGVETSSDSGSGVGTGSGSGASTGSGSGVSTGSSQGQGYQGAQAAAVGTTADAGASSSDSSSVGDSKDSADSKDVDGASGDKQDAYEIIPKDLIDNLDTNTVATTAAVVISVLLLLVVGIKKQFVLALLGKIFKF